MRVAAIAIGVVFVAGSAAAQQSADFGTVQGTIATPKGGATESLGPGAAAWAKRTMSEQDYVDELARQYAAAQTLVGQPLSDKDRAEIRKRGIEVATELCRRALGSIRTGTRRGCWRALRSRRNGGGGRPHGVLGRRDGGTAGPRT